MLCDFLDFSFKRIQLLEIVLQPLLSYRGWSLSNEFIRRCFSLFICICGLSQYCKTLIISIGFLMHMAIYFVSTDFNLASFVKVYDYLMIACLLSHFFRLLEIFFGPKRIPDTQRSYFSLNFLLSLIIRRLRQLIEVVLFSLVPTIGFLNFSMSEFRDFPDGYVNVCHNMIDKIYYVLLLFLLFSFAQRVFGSNPSYKGTIQDQYGEVLRNPVIKFSTLGNPTNETGKDDEKITQTGYKRNTRQSTRIAKSIAKS